jgi:hypothetical protein
MWQPSVGGADGRTVERGRDSARVWAAEEGADEHWSLILFLPIFHEAIAIRAFDIFKIGAIAHGGRVMHTPG